MSTATKQTLTVHDLYDVRDNIGLSRKECKQPPRTRSLFEWGKSQQAYYLNNLAGGITRPPKVFIYEPFTSSGKAAVLDGRQRLKALFSYLDGNFPMGETAPDGWAGKTYKQLQATTPELADALMRTPCQTSVINATSYWEAAVAVYPQICGHTRETVELEQEMLMHHLNLADYSDPDCNIFTDKEYCDWEVSNLKMGIAHQNRTAQIEFRCTERGRGVLVPQLLPHGISTMIAEWQLRATEFVARHHHRGVIPC